MSVQFEIIVVKYYFLIIDDEDDEDLDPSTARKRRLAEKAAERDYGVEEEVSNF